MLQPKIIRELAVCAVLGAIFNVVGFKWGSSCGYGNPPKSLSIAKSLIYLIRFNIQDVRNSAAATGAISFITGMKQTVIQQILNYLKW